MKKNPLSNNGGMTLLEILVALAIMATLTYYIATTIQKSAQSKVKIEKDIDRYSTVRDALRIMEADINRAFHYRDINTELYNEAMKEREKRIQEAGSKPSEGGTADQDGQAGQTPPNPETPPPGEGDEGGQGTGQQAFQPKEIVILTHFIGKEDELNFTTLNNVRTVSGSQESDQMEVGYRIEQCRGRVNKKKRSDCLWRRTSPIIDDDIEQGGEETVLLEDVTKFQLRYLGPSEDSEPEWETGWNSKVETNAEQAGKFPYAVEVTLETQDKDNESAKATAMTMVAQIRNPNNAQKKPEPEATNAEETPPPSN